MLSNTINFINQFWPERIEHWKELDEKTTQILVNSKLLTKTFESNILNVDKDPILSSLYVGKLDEIKLILSHPKQAYDILIIKSYEITVLIFFIKIFYKQNVVSLFWV